MFIVALLRARLHNVCSKTRGPNQPASLPHRMVCKWHSIPAQPSQPSTDLHAARIMAIEAPSTTIIHSKTGDVSYSHGCRWLWPHRAAAAAMLTKQLQ